MRILIVALCLLPSCLFAAAPQATLDNGTIRVIIPNNGSFAYDPEDELSGGPGLFFPSDYPVDLMGGAGIWVAGKVEDEWRVSIAGGQSEFVSGPAYSFDTLAPEFPIFHASRYGDHNLNDDYRQWPAHLGAPVDAFGRPLVTGAESVFAVFSDTDTLSHGFSISNTPPLGIEGRLYAYTFDRVSQVYDTLLAQVVFLEYSITNITETQIDSCILTLYADPDIGYSRDDLIASDSAAQGAFAYQADGYDIYFGYNPPVAGLVMLSEPLSSTNFYHFRSEYDTLPQTINLMLGRDLEGNLYRDSTSGLATHFPYGGYPELDSGWLLQEENDWRLMLNLTPRNLAPGETMRIKAALVVARGNDVNESIRGWRQTASLLHELEITPPRIKVSLDNQAIGSNSDSLLLRLTNPTLFEQYVTVKIIGSNSLIAYPSFLEMGAAVSDSVFLTNDPAIDGERSLQAVVSSLGYSLFSDTLQVPGEVLAPANAGDLNHSGELDLSDIVLLVRALYDDGDSPPRLDNCDSDCDADFDLVDLVRFINHFFYGTELTCR